MAFWRSAAAIDVIDYVHLIAQKVTNWVFLCPKVDRNKQNQKVGTAPPTPEG